MNNWINVNDKLPDVKSTHKLKYRDGFYTMSVRVLCACRQKSGDRMVKEGYCEVWNDRAVVWRIPGTIDEVTHWMPLPELPEEEERETN